MTAPNLIHPDNTDMALLDVRTERQRQDLRWGEQNHSAERWLAILMEEVGELATAILHTTFNDHPKTHQGMLTHGTGNIRTEANQVAAVAVALVEYIDRGQPTT